MLVTNRVPSLNRLEFPKAWPMSTGAPLRGMEASPFAPETSFESCTVTLPASREEGAAEARARREREGDGRTHFGKVMSMN